MKSTALSTKRDGRETGVDWDCGVTVMSGATTKALQVAHQKVEDVRKILKETFNIGDATIALVNGKEAKEDQVLNPADRLEFVKEAGNKG